MKLIIFFFFVSALSLASPQGVPVQSTVTCGTSPQVMLAQNNSRGYLLFQNQGADTGHCRFKAGSIMVSGTGLWVDSGQNYETVEAYTKKPWYCQCDVSSTIEVLESNW